MKNLTDWFDRVLVINLPERTDRKAALISNLTATGMMDPNLVQFIPAEATTETAPEWWRAGKGGYGCLQSHLRCLEIAKDYGSCLILEDDAFFVPDALDRLNRFMATVPEDWGQVYLGGKSLEPKQKTQSPEVMIGRRICATHCYAVSSRHLPAVTACAADRESYIRHAWYLDFQLSTGHAARKWPVYCPPQWLAGQTAGRSSVSGKEYPARMFC